MGGLNPLINETFEFQNPQLSSSSSVLRQGRLKFFEEEWTSPLRLHMMTQ